MLKKHKPLNISVIFHIHINPVNSLSQCNKNSDFLHCRKHIEIYHESNFWWKKLPL